MPAFAITSRQEQLFNRVVDGLSGIGYREDLLQKDYKFVDWFESSNLQRRVPAAAFAQSPPSYSTACFAVTFGEIDVWANSLGRLRALGAPYAFIVLEDRVEQWKVGRNEAVSKRLCSYNLESLDATFRDCATTWSGAEILRLKNIPSRVGQRQLDFIDAGLIPALEEHVRTKLGSILRETLSLGVRIYKEQFKREPDAPELYRLTFSLLAGKVLHDREVGVFPSFEAKDVTQILEATQEYYHPSGPVLDYRPTQNAIADGLWGRVSFDNLTVEVLAYIWEHSFITESDRVEHGIYGTPYELAKHAAYSLMDDNFVIGNRLILEPCCGHGIFLVAALQRLRELLPPFSTPAQKHLHFSSALFGFDQDPFAVEVARLCLSLADFPNRNGWNTYQGDVFKSNMFDSSISRSKVVLCNPPFRNFTPRERGSYGGSIAYAQRPAELLRRILERLPLDGVLGFILPRKITDGRGAYSEIREHLATRFGEVEVVALPDDVFEESEVETALVLCKSPAPLRSQTTIRFIDISDQSWESFRSGCRYPEPATQEKSVDESTRSLEVATPSKLGELWKKLASNETLGQISTVHRGIEWRPLPGGRRPNEGYNERFQARYTSTAELDGYRLGVSRAVGMKAFRLPTIKYLSFRNADQRPTCEGIFRYPWEKPKVVVSASRITREKWRVAACPDNEGLAFTQRFLVVWPSEPWSPNCIAAILNGPVVAAFFSSNEANRDNLTETVKKVPLPKLSNQSRLLIDKYVDEYVHLAQSSVSLAKNEPLRQLLLRIDAEILMAYNLPPRIERMLLDYFRGARRPVVHPFGDYFPESFTPKIPLWRYIARNYQKLNAKHFLENIPDIDDPRLMDALTELE